MELFRETNINFLRWKWWAIGASWALIFVGLIAIFVAEGAAVRDRLRGRHSRSP